MKSIYIHLVLAFVFGCGNLYPSVVNVKDRGAIGDGLTLDTNAIQKAIDECSTGGGGTVLFPAGRFLSGTIQIRDNVTLQLSEKATLLGSTHLTDYRVIEGFKDGLGVQVGAAFIIAVDAINIGIEGLGIINGQGADLAKAQASSGDKNWGARPFLIRLLRCEGVSLKQVHITASAAWTVHLSRCKDAKVQEVTINSFGLPHNDGMDIDSCENMDIANCFVHSGDDSICFKTLGPFPCHDITINQCTLQSSEAAVKCGTESVGPFRNLTVSNCTIIGAREGGIKLFSVDGADMENISISNIKMSHVNLPIMIRLGARLHTFRLEDKPQSIGFIRGITISNIEAVDCANVGILISGIPRHLIENVTLQNVKLGLAGGEMANQMKLEENPQSYPEVTMFGKEMPVYGLFARHVSGLSISGLTFDLQKSDSRPASYFDDAPNHTSIP